jgi:acetylornithine deacetylase/succinyl-diaminopimelate desuccinylase-like protein
MPLMLPLDVQSLAMSLVNIASPQGRENSIATAIENALVALPHLEVERSGDTVVARSTGASEQHVLVTARIDAPAPADEDAMAYVEMGKLFGAGASGAKGAVAVLLKAIARPGLTRDATFVFHAGELEAATIRGIAAEHPVDFAVVAGPTHAVVSGRDVTHPLAQELAASATQGSPAVTSEDGSAALAELGIPSVAFGPGDAAIAGTDAEFVPTAELGESEHMLRAWLTA